MEEFGDSDYYEGDSEEEDIEHDNYKGIYFGEEPGQKYIDPETGAHFQFSHMVELLDKVIFERKQRSVEP